MSDEKHFNYESQDPVVPSQEEEIEIEDVVFLTPARVDYDKDGEKLFVNVSVDLVNRKAYTTEGQEWSNSDKVFEYLDKITTLPEDFFEASEDIYDRAEKAQEDLEEITKVSKNQGVE